MRRQTIIVSIVLAQLVLSCVSRTYKDDLKIVNRAKEPVENVQIEVCGKILEVRDIQPDSAALITYEIESDCHYTISVFFKSGRNVRKEIGYVTHGFSYEHEVNITESDVLLTLSKVKMDKPQ